MNIADCYDVSAQVEMKPLSNSPLDGLKQRKFYLQEQMANVDAAIAALERNPEILNVLELLAKANRR